MNRRTFIGATGAGVSIALSGCMEKTSEPQSSGNIDAQTIDVSASGEAEAEPDKAVARVGVEATGSEASEVRNEISERADAVHEALVDRGVAEDNITTAQYGIQEEYQETGYNGNHSYTVEIEDVDEAGELIDVAVDAGADDIGSVDFTLSEETRDEVREEAIEAAIDTARAEAETIADTKGLSISGVENIATQESNVRPFSPREEAAYAEDSAGEGASEPTTIEQGPVSVTAQVDVAYQFSE